MLKIRANKQIYLSLIKIYSVPTIFSININLAHKETVKYYFARIAQTFRIVVTYSVVFASLFIYSITSHAKTINEEDFQYIKKLAYQSGIIGMSVAIIKDNNTIIYWNYGYSNKSKKIPVTHLTEFQIASLSKSFTAMAIVKLALEHKINLDTSLKSIIPKFTMQHNGTKTITARNLLQHTSGIPWQTITLLDTVTDYEGLYCRLSHFNPKSEPGVNFEYAAINYVILGDIIEKLSGQSFSSFMVNNIFKPIGLNNTYLPDREHNAPIGYKIGFWRPFLYLAPSYRLNFPSGYINSNIIDMSKWLKFQMDANSNPSDILSRAAYVTQQPNKKIVAEPDNNSYYGMGWFINPNGDVNHTGLNPNFATYMAFSPNHKIGIVILANTNSYAIYRIGDFLINRLKNQPNSIQIQYDFLENIDLTLSWVSLILMLYGISMLYYIYYTCSRAHIQRLTNKHSKYKILLSIIAICLGFIFLPPLLTKMSWTTIMVWLPISAVVLWIELGIFIPLTIITILLKKQTKITYSKP